MQHETKIEELTENVKEYINTQYELVVLKSTGKVTTVASELIAELIVALVLFFSLLFLSFAGAWYLGTILESRELGLFIVGAGYLVFGLILWFARKSLVIRPLRNKMIYKIFKQDSF